MKLSVIIPVYRTENTLDQCVESVVGQTFGDLEIILVDDGSPDRCPLLCDELERRDPRIKVIHQPNGGLSRARNAGMSLAGGELITFVDSDDYVEKDTYRQVVALAEGNDIVEYSYYWHYGGEDEKHVRLEDRTYEDMGRYWLEGQGYSHCFAWNKVYRRELFSDVHFPEDRVFEDVHILPQLLQKARRVSTTSKGCYFYCANKQGISATARGRELSMLLESHIRAMDKWCDDTYYMHVLNTQMDVCEMTGQTPILSWRRVNALAKGMNGRLRLKAIVQNLIGMNGICYTNQLLHRLTGRHL